jgi:hypothetical protein
LDFEFLLSSIDRLGPIAVTHFGAGCREDLGRDVRVGLGDADGVVGGGNFVG